MICCKRHILVLEWGETQTESENILRYCWIHNMKPGQQVTFPSLHINLMMMEISSGYTMMVNPVSIICRIRAIPATQLGSLSSTITSMVLLDCQ